MTLFGESAQTSPRLGQQVASQQESPRISILHLGESQNQAALVKAVIEKPPAKLAAIIRTVSTKGEYIAALQSGGFDIIFCGQQEAEYDGNAALKDARVLCPRVPFIIVKGERGEARAIKALGEAVLEWERRHKESLIARHYADLAEAHQQLQAVINGMTEGLHIADMQGNVLLVNARGAELLGFTNPEGYLKALPEFIATFELFSPSGERLSFEQWPSNKLLHGETVRDYVVTVHRMDTNQYVTLSHNGSITCDEKGNPRYAVLTYRDVTAQIRAQETLRHKEEELREAQRVARVGSWYWDAKTDQVTVSDEIFDLYGLDPAMPYPSLKEQEGTLLPPRSWALVSAAIARTVNTGEPYELEFEVNHGKGGTVWVIARGEAVHNTQGETIGLRGIVQDITERKRTEDRIAFLASFPELNPNPVLEVDASGVVSYANKASAIIPKSLNSDQDLHRFVPADIEVLLLALRQHEGPVTFCREVTIGTRTFAENVHVFRQLGVLRIYANDVTEQKVAEEALRESEERFRTMADSTPVMIWVTNASGEIEFVNHAYEEFFGRTEAQVRGPASWKMIVHQDDEASYRVAFAKAHESHTSFDAVGRVKHCSGEWRWVHSHGAPRFSGSGEFLGLVGSSPDITDQKSAADALKTSVENLRLMVSYASEAMMVIDGDGRIEALSSLGSRLLGYEEGELLGKRIDQFAETFSRLEASLTLENLRKGAPRPMTNSLRVKIKGGIVQWMSVTGTLVKLGTQGEKYLVKFQKLELPALQINGR
jgi:PAS domain S-box-containing protein